LRDEGFLKIFAGADPRPILASRREWHRLKIEELEGHLRTLQETRRQSQQPLGPEHALLAGVAFHGKMLELLTELASSDCIA